MAISGTRAGNLVVWIDYEPGIPAGIVATRVAATLDLPVIDREITAQAAHRLGIPMQLASELEVEPDHPVERWLLAAAEGDQAVGLWGPTTAQSDPLLQPRAELMAAVRAAIQELLVPPCVIVGHEAGYILEGQDDKTRVLLRAERSIRQRWLMDKPGRMGRRKSVAQLDRAKRTYVRQMFGRCWPEIASYELIVDVTQHSWKATADVIAGFVAPGVADDWPA